MSKAITKTYWTESDYDFLRKNYQELTYGELGEKIGKTKSAVQNKLKVLGLKKPEKYFYNKRFFKEIDTQEKAYWLGFMYADGFVCFGNRNAEVGIELKSSDIDHLRKFNKSLNGNVSPSIRQRETEIMGNYEIASIRFYSKDMAMDLVLNGCVERKTDKICFPNLSEELSWHFLRGFFDGDGCLVLNKPRYAHRFDFCSSSLQMLEQIKSFLYKKNIYSYIKEEDKTKKLLKTTMPNYRLYISGMENAYLFGKYLYKNANIYLDRKKCLFDNITSQNDIIDRIQTRGHHGGPHHK